jgi:hypothetical protein
VKYWEIIADNLSKAGWSWGCVATVAAPALRILSQKIEDSHPTMTAPQHETAPATYGLG